MGRRLGQHFLVRKSILDRIATAICITGHLAQNPAREKELLKNANHGDAALCPLVIEIGPGKGALTECLLERAQKVVALEVDTFLVHYLRQKFSETIDTGRLVLIEGDVLKTDLSAWGPAAVAGNLPYYITSPILEKLFELGDNWKRAVFLVQAEVAARLVAEPCTRDFGYLSVQTQLNARAEILFPVPANAFRPPPKVESAAILLQPRDSAGELGVADHAGFLRFASSCFRQKRKTLRNNLAPLYGKERLDALAEGRLRAEQLSVTDLIALYHKLGPTLA